jgi:Leucine-rich repeat (LRR) protein
MQKLKFILIFLFLNYAISFDLVCNRHPELDHHLHCEVIGLTDDHTITGYKSLSNQNFDNEKEVTISYKNLQQKLPFGIGSVFPYLTSLDVSVSNVKNIERKNFVGMKNLRDLRLFFNNIEQLPDDVFSDLEELQWLNIAKNSIKVLPNDIFTRNLKLKKLQASENFIDTITSETFRNNPLLEEVYLNKNKIKNFMADFTEFTHLKMLDLTENYGTCNKRYWSTISKKNQEEIYKICKK